MMNSVEKFLSDFKKIDSASVGVVIVKTDEPYRVGSELHGFMSAKGNEMVEWTQVNGFYKFDIKGKRTKMATEKEKNLIPALQFIDEHVVPKSGGCTVFNFIWPHYQYNPVAVHKIYELSRDLTANLNKKRLIISVPHSITIPREFSEIPVIELETPNFAEIKEELDKALSIIHNANPALVPDMKAADYTKLVRASAGFTSNEAYQTFRRVIIEQKSNLPNWNIEEVLASIHNIKAELLKKSNLLTLGTTEDMKNVGGLEVLKEWIVNRKPLFTKEAREFGINPPRGIALVGAPGCLSGDTIISYSRGKRSGSRDISLEDLYCKFNGIKINTRCWDHLTDTKIQSIDHETGKVFYNKIISVIESGEKDLWLLTTKSGRQLKLTNDHPVLTDSGYVCTRDLSIGDTLVVVGDMKPTKSTVKHGRKPRVVVEGLKYYSGGWDKFVTNSSGTYKYKRQHRSRLVIEARMNDLEYKDYLFKLKNDPEAIKLKTLDNGMVVHHIDENPMNDSLDNLQLLLKFEHDKLHTDEGNFNVNYTELDQVESVDYYGLEQTYDIQMELPCNNFATANGLLVHNTGKSLVSKAIAKELNLPLIVFDIGKCFNSLVGKTEENMREALQTVKSLAPAVVLLDEFDKVFGSGESNVQVDSGIGQRIFGTLLNFMQECKEPVFFIASLNRINGIKPEFFRKGRLDEVWSVSLPTEEERKEIINIHLRKRNKTEFKGKPMDSIIDATVGFTASELEAGINEALIKAFNTKKKIVTLEIVIESMKEIIPNSVSFKAQYDEMQAWSAKYARAAGKATNKVAVVTKSKEEEGEYLDLDLDTTSLDS